MSSTRELIIVGEADPIRVLAGFVDINNHICILGQPETLRRLATALGEAAEAAEASGDEQWTRLVAGLLVLGACSPATVGVPPSSTIAGTPVGPEAGYPTREAKAGAAASVPGVPSTSGPTPSPVRGHGAAGDPQPAPGCAPHETPTDGTTSPPQAAVRPTTAPPLTGPGEGSPPAGEQPWNGPVLVSWYGEESGSVTASGEPFDPVALTAAHRTLPFGTLVEMAYTRSGGARSLVTVRINDRGPFVAGRAFDVSRGAMVALAGGAGIVEGVVEVRWRMVVG